MYWLSFLFHFLFTSTHKYSNMLLEANLIPSYLGLPYISMHPLEYNAILCIPKRGNHTYISSPLPLWLLTQWCFSRLTLHWLHKTDSLLLKFPWLLDTPQGMLIIHATGISRKEPQTSFQIISIALEWLS